MKSRLSERVLITLIFCFLYLSLASIEFTPNELIIKTTEPQAVSGGRFDLFELDSFLDSKSSKQIRPITKKSDNKFFVVSMENSVSKNEINGLDFPGVEYIQLNYLNSFYEIPDDPLYFDQERMLELSCIQEAWNLSIGNDEIIVAMVDSGIHFDHPDLQNNIYINDAEIPDDGIDNDGNGYVDDWRGWDFVDAPELYDLATGDYLEQDNDPTDEINHGTHLAGIVAADTDNATGISGISWFASLLIIRAGFNAGNAGYLQDDDAAAAIIYAADMGADVINLSWGDINYSPIIADACTYAYNKGSILVASSGNTYGVGIMYPARLSTTIAVGAVDKFSNIAGFSSYGPELDIVAPGVNIISTYTTSSSDLYKAQTGTSMASPFVTGSIALLLSVEPELGFHEVKSRLHCSAIDLGDPGYDIVYGNGLLNTYNLLTMVDQPIIEITSPADLSGIHQNIYIMGTVKSPNFSKYSIMYSVEEDPGAMDWYDTISRENTPTYYYDEVFDDVIGEFNILGLPDDEYLIKVEIITSENQHYSNVIHLNLDQTEPELDINLLGFMKRYDEERTTFFLQTVYDDVVDQETRCYSSTGETITFSQIPSNVQVAQLPVEAPVGAPLEVNISVTATNISGLQQETALPGLFPIESDYIDVNSFEISSGSNIIISCGDYFDLDGNGKLEFPGVVKNSDGERELNIYEFSGDEPIIKHNMDLENIISVLAMGDTDLQRQELLLWNTLSKVVLYETPIGGIYPADSIWSSDTVYVFNAKFLDYNGDGDDEIVLIKNITIDQIVTHRVLSLINRYGMTFNEEYIIFNPSETNFRNEFIAMDCGDLDGDPFPDLITTDKDGDIMIFEMISYNQYMLSWSHRMPVRDCFYLAIADLNGDGFNEFIVGGYNRNDQDQGKNFTYFELFGNTGSDNSYESLGYISFKNMEENNSLNAIDLDGNGDDELVINVSPNIYVVDYDGEKLKPIWFGKASTPFNNMLIAIPATDHEVAHVITSVPVGDDYQSAIIKASAPFEGPVTPTSFSAVPQNSHSVELSWSYAGSVDSFTIYKKVDGVVSAVGNHQDTEVVINGFNNGDSLQFCVTANQVALTPPESLPTLWKQAITAPVPNLISTEMISSNQLQLIFDEQLFSDSISREFYNLNHDYGYPASVNTSHQQKGVVLLFHQPFVFYDDYLININGPTGKTGVPIPSISQELDFQPDITSPEILETIAETDDLINLYFTESIQITSAEDIDNYNVLMPAIDSNNELIGVEYKQDNSGFYVQMNFLYDLKYTNQTYFLRVENLYDLAGNEISNKGNKCHFSLTGTAGLRNLKSLKVYPNPLNQKELKESDEFSIHFSDFPLGKTGKLRIYNLNGNLIFEDTVGPFDTAAQHYRWLATNSKGEHVSSGIYFYHFQMGSEFRKGKLAIIN